MTNKKDEFEEEGLENSDDTDLDFGSLDDDLDFDDDFAEEKPKKIKKRKPATDFSVGVLEGFKPSTESFRTIQNGVSNSFPETGKMIEGTIDTVSEISRYKDEVIKGIQPSLNKFKIVSKRLLPKVEKILPKKLYAKLDEKLTPHEEYKAKSVEEQNNEFISGQLSAIFNQQAEAEKEKYVNDQVDKTIDRKLEVGYQDKSTVIFSQIRNLLKSNQLFFQTSFKGYMMKDLELKFKHLFVTKDLFSLTKTMVSILDNKLEEIKHNTALPETVKKNASEEYKHGLKMKLIGSTGEKLSDITSGIRGKVMKNIKEKVFDKAKDTLNDILNMAADAGEMQLDAEEMAKEFGEEPSSAARTGGGFVGRLLQKALIKTGIAGVKGALGEKGNTLEDKMKHARETALYKINDIAQGDTWYGKMLKEIIPEMSEERGTVSNTLSQNAAEEVPFDVLTRRSIIEVIPGYLAKILQQVEFGTNIAKTTSKISKKKLIGLKPDELIFDKDTEDFISLSDYKERKHKKLFETKEKRTEDVSKIVEKLYAGYSLNEEASDEEFQSVLPELINFINNLAKHAKVVNPKLIVDYLKGKEVPEDKENYLDYVLKDVPEEQKETLGNVLSKSFFKNYEEALESEGTENEVKLEERGRVKRDVDFLTIQLGKERDQIIDQLADFNIHGGKRHMKGLFSIKTKEDIENKEKELIEKYKKENKGKALTDAQKDKIRNELIDFANKTDLSHDYIRKQLSNVDTGQVFSNALTKAEENQEAIKAEEDQEPITAKSLAENTKKEIKKKTPNWLQKLFGVKEKEKTANEKRDEELSSFSRPLSKEEIEEAKEGVEEATGEEPPVHDELNVSGPGVYVQGTEKELHLPLDQGSEFWKRASDSFKKALNTSKMTKSFGKVEKLNENMVDAIEKEGVTLSNLSSNMINFNNTLKTKMTDIGSFISTSVKGSKLGKKVTDTITNKDGNITVGSVAEGGSKLVLDATDTIITKGGKVLDKTQEAVTDKEGNVTAKSLLKGIKEGATKGYNKTKEETKKQIEKASKTKLGKDIVKKTEEAQKLASEKYEEFEKSEAGEYLKKTKKTINDKIDEAVEVIVDEYAKTLYPGNPYKAALYSNEKMEKYRSFSGDPVAAINSLGSDIIYKLSQSTGIVGKYISKYIEKEEKAKKEKLSKSQQTATAVKEKKNKSNKNIPNIPISKEEIPKVEEINEEEISSIAAINKTLVALNTSIDKMEDENKNIITPTLDNYLSIMKKGLDKLNITASQSNENEKSEEKILEEEVKEKEVSKPSVKEISDNVVSGVKGFFSKLIPEAEAKETEAPIVKEVEKETPKEASKASFFGRVKGFANKAMSQVNEFLPEPTEAKEVHEEKAKEEEAPKEETIEEKAKKETPIAKEVEKETPKISFKEKSDNFVNEAKGFFGKWFPEEKKEVKATNQVATKAEKTDEEILEEEKQQTKSIGLFTNLLESFSERFQPTLTAVSDTKKSEVKENFKGMESSDLMVENVEYQKKIHTTLEEINNIQKANLAFSMNANTKGLELLGAGFKLPKIQIKTFWGEFAKGSTNVVSNMVKSAGNVTGKFYTGLFKAAGATASAAIKTTGAIADTALGGSGTVLDLAKSGLGAVGNAIGKIFGFYKGAASGAKTNIQRLIGLIKKVDRFSIREQPKYVDVYLKNMVEIGKPLLTARQQVDEEVVFNDGSMIKDSYSINKPVIDVKTKQTIITENHLKNGLVNVDGKPLNKKLSLESIGKKAFNAAKKVIKGAYKFDKAVIGTAAEFGWETTKAVAKPLGTATKAVLEKPLAKAKKVGSEIPGVKTLISKYDEYKEKKQFLEGIKHPGKIKDIKYATDGRTVTNASLYSLVTKRLEIISDIIGEIAYSMGIKTTPFNKRKKGRITKKEKNTDKIYRKEKLEELKLEKEEMEERKEELEEENQKEILRKESIGNRLISKTKKLPGGSYLAKKAGGLKDRLMNKGEKKEGHSTLGTLINAGKDIAETSMEAGAVTSVLGGTSILGSIVGGIGSIVGGIGSTLAAAGTAVAGAISAPVVLGALAVAAVGTAGYFAYKHHKKAKKADKLRQMRIKLYNAEKVDPDLIEDLEDRLDDVDNSGKMTPDEIKDFADQFGFDTDNENQVGYFSEWLNKIFAPTFMAYRKYLKEVSKTDFSDEGSVDDDTLAYIIKSFPKVVNEQVSKYKYLIPTMDGYTKASGEKEKEKKKKAIAKKINTEEKNKTGIKENKEGPNVEKTPGEKVAATITPRRKGSITKSLYDTDTGGKVIPLIKPAKELGSLSAEYESGTKGSAAIGYDKTGGTSYGKYQLSSKTGTFNEFIEWAKKEGPEGKEVADALEKAGKANTGGKTGNVPKVWRELAKAGKIDKLTHAFIKETHYDKALKEIKTPAIKEMVNSSKALQNVLWSTAVQHGPESAAKIFKKAYKKDITLKEYIRNIYKERSNHFKSSSSNIRRNINNRFQNEMITALVSAGSPEDKQYGIHSLLKKSIDNASKSIADKTNVPIKKETTAGTKNLPAVSKNVSKNIKAINKIPNNISVPDLTENQHSLITNKIRSANITTTSKNDVPKLMQTQIGLLSSIENHLSNINSNVTEIGNIDNGKYIKTAVDDLKFHISDVFKTPEKATPVAQQNPNTTRDLNDIYEKGFNINVSKKAANI